MYCVIVLGISGEFWESIGVGRFQISSVFSGDCTKALETPHHQKHMKGTTIDKQTKHEVPAQSNKGTTILLCFKRVQYFSIKELLPIFESNASEVACGYSTVSDVTEHNHSHVWQQNAWTCFTGESPVSGPHHSFQQRLHEVGEQFKEAMQH